MTTKPACQSRLHYKTTKRNGETTLNTFIAKKTYKNITRFNKHLESPRCKKVCTLLLT